MNKKLEKVMYMGIGALIALISFSLGNLHRDNANAQGGTPIVDLIRCKRLEVVDAAGNNRIILRTNQDDGRVDVYNGHVSIYDKAGKLGATLYINEDGGRMYIYDKAGKSGASLSTDENGGRMSVFGKAGMSAASLGTDEDGGRVGVRSKDGKTGATLGITKYGGGVAIFNRGEQNVGQFSVTDRGGGLLLTKDKHGYRTGNVP